MAGPKVKQEFKPAMKCIFEDAGKTTATHVFPDCLNNHIELPGNRFQDTRYAVGKDQSDEREFNIKQGGMFTQAPFIACKTCNGGWMRYFEDEILKFILPILTTHDRVVLNHKQMKLLAGWTALITITNEFINRNTPPVIPVKDRLYLKEKGEPPRTWSIFASSLDGFYWRARPVQWTKVIAFGEGVFDSQFAEESQKKIDAGLTPNTQMSSFGIGNLFLQVFTTPYKLIAGDYQAAAKKTGLIQIWPIPLPILWPLQKGTAKFPTKLVLTDETAENLSLAFRDVIDRKIPKNLDYSSRRGRRGKA